MAAMTTFRALRHKARFCLQRMKGYCDVSLAGEKFQCDPESWRFWRHVNTGKWEPHTLQMLRTVLGPNDIFLDIGAYIGPTAIYASRFCKHVYCLEPDPVAYELLLKNIRLNKIHNITTAQFGLFTEKKQLFIGNPKGLGTSGSSLLYSDSQGAASIQTLSLADVTAMWSLPKVKLMKIDIEGAEFDLVPQIEKQIFAMADCVYFSTHAPHFPENERKGKMQKVLSFFQQYPYIYNEHLQLMKPEDIFSSENMTTYPEFLCSKNPINW
jgi:FkbM family methyltransferase